MTNSIQEKSTVLVNQIVAGNNPDIIKPTFEEINRSIQETQEEVRKRMAQAKQRVTEQAERNALDIRELSKLVIIKRLEESMDNAIDRVGTRLNMSEDTKIKIRSIIRGYKYSEITESPIVADAISKTEKVIADFCKQQEKIFREADKIGEGFSKINDKVENFSKKIDNFTKKAEDFSKLTEEEQINKILNSITNGIKNNKGLDDFCKKVDKLINVNGLYKQLTGEDFNSKNMLLPILSKIEKNIGQKLEGKLKPFIDKHIEVVKKISETVKKVWEKIKEAEKHFKEMLKKYEDMAKKMAEDFTKKLADEISKRVKITYTAGGGIGGALGMGVDL